MKIVLLLTFLFGITLADTKGQMLRLFQNKEYEKACNLGYDTYKENKRDEEFISLYAFSCLYSDYIDRLSAPASLLKLTPESRANSAYFAVIVMQKKLLYHALLDGYKLSNFKLPSTDYILSKVFDLYVKAKKNKRNIYIFKDPDDSKITYKLYLRDDYKIKKMVIEEYYDTIAVKSHEYW